MGCQRGTLATLMYNFKFDSVIIYFWAFCVLLLGVIRE